MKSGSILVIEDEPAVADNISYALRTEGFEPVCCATGGEGLARLSEAHVDLVILDVGLPDANGFDLCREIRRTSGVPIVFLTARADEIDRIVGLEIGGDDYVVKPFSPRELVARVKAVLRRGSREDARPEPAQEGLPFAVDRERFVIHYFGQPLTLTRYEFRILDVLIGKPGRVYSRDALLDLCWEEPEASMARTVDAHVKSIRAKLREIRSDIDPVVTHRGLGYSLKEDW